MNFRLTLSLAIVVLLLASTYLLISVKKSQPIAAAQVKSVIDPAPTDVQAITYIHDADDQLKFVKSGDSWNMTFPINAPVEKLRVQDIADALRTLSYKEAFEPENSGVHSPESTGTAKPHDVIKFTDRAGKEYTLTIGKVSASGTYATISGSKSIYILAKNPLGDLDHEPDDFRNKIIKEVPMDKVNALTIKHGDDTYTLAKSSDKWVVTAPVSARANATAVDEILNEMHSINANQFSKLTKQLTGLDHPIASVTATVQDSASVAAATGPATASAPATAPTTMVTLELGIFTDAAKKQYVYASLGGSNEIFTLRKETFDKLNRELKDLRDPAITPAPVATATEVNISAEGAPALGISKKDGKWKLTTTNPALDGDTLAIGDYLGVVRDLRAIKYVDNAGDLKSIGLDPPHMKIDLALPGQTQHEVLLVGKPETADKVTPVMRQGEPTVYLVQTSDADRLNTSPITLRDRTIESLSGDRIRGIAISGPAATNGTTTAPATTSAPASRPSVAAGIDLQRDGSHWVIKNGDKSTAADDIKVSPLLGDFTPLTAVKYIADNGELPGTPSVVATLTILEPTISPASVATALGGGPATTNAVASTKPAATIPTDLLPSLTPAGPDPGKIVTHTLRLYKQEANNVMTWKAVWDNQSPRWTFEPTPALVDHLTKESYAVPATQPAIKP